jgi:hypothetical protein
MRRNAEFVEISIGDCARPQEPQTNLRNDLMFSPAIIERPVPDYPVYAQKKPVDGVEISPVDHDKPLPIPVVGDFLVEDFDPLTDKFTQKIYDAATFVRYFKESLN